MTTSMTYASAEAPTTEDRYRSSGPLREIKQGPSVDSSRVDRNWQLREALRRRDATAAECLVSTFGDRAYRLALSITGKQQDAEEAVQDAFWHVIRKIHTFRGDAALGSWIYRITVNAANNRRRRSCARRRREFSLDEILSAFREDGHHADRIVASSTELDDPAVQAELRDVLTSALEELPAHYGAVIILQAVEGLSMAEVAKCLDITRPTAKTRAHRARLLLRHRLAEFVPGTRSSDRSDCVARRATGPLPCRDHAARRRELVEWPRRVR